MSDTHEKTIARRGFLKSAAATAGLTILKPGSALGSEANSKLEIGVIGCGHRGTWIGKLFEDNTNTKVVALHDYFKTQVDAAGERLAVDPSRRHIGLDGYKELLAGKVDAVAIETPPYFHPEQTLAALDAGKHVYLAKPIAVDVPGCLAIVDAANRAQQAKLTTLVDFQTRKDPFYQEAVRRVHEGLIGSPICGQSYYHCGRLGMRAQPGTDVARLKNWVFDKALSGDIIVEQNIHVLDVANWLLRGRPVKAQGTGGRKARVDVGDCWDHFIVTFTYPDDVLIDFSSNQFAPGFDDLCTRVFCPQGTIDTHYGGEIVIDGKSEAYRPGKTTRIYLEGAVANIKDFHQSIMDSTPLNNAQESADSTMTSILGRMAAYQGRPVTWDEMLQQPETIDPRLVLPEDGPMS